MDILQDMKKIFCVALHMNCLSLLLGHPSQDAIVGASSGRLYNILAYATWKNIFMSWISDKPPTKANWHKIIMEFFSSWEYHLPASLFKRIVQRFTYADFMGQCYTVLFFHCLVFKKETLINILGGKNAMQAICDVMNSHYVHCSDRIVWILNSFPEVSVILQ